MSLSQADAARIEWLWQGFRAEGLTDPGIAIEQVAYLMTVRRLLAGHRGNSPFGPEIRDWRDLLRLPDGRLIPLMVTSLIPAVALSMPPSIRPTIGEARFAIDSVALLRQCLSTIDELDLDWSDAAAGGEVFEALLGWLRLAGHDRGRRTSSALARAMVALAGPRPGDRICDPAVGTGNLLLTAAEWIGSSGFFGGPRGLWGYDIDPGMARLAAFNLWFHGIAEANVEQADALAPDFRAETFDVVICAPPFGGTRTQEDVDWDLAAAGKRTEVLYLERCRQMLGRSAAILVPEAVLFGRGTQFQRARREWLAESRVRAVILLPAGLLSFAGVRSAILVASGSGSTEDVWFCPIGGDGETPVAAADEVNRQLGVAAEALSFRAESVMPTKPEAVSLGERMFKVPIAAIRENDWSLSPADYHDADVPPEEANPLALLGEVGVLEGEIGRHIAEAHRLMANQE